MSANGDKVIHAPPAVAQISHPGPGVEDVQALARAQGITMSPEDVIAAQQAQIRELQQRATAQELAATTFANAIACLVMTLQHDRPQEGLTVVLGRNLIDKMDGAKVACEETGDRDLRVTITERMD